jgi:hypothetical protein
VEDISLMQVTAIAMHSTLNNCCKSTNNKKKKGEENGKKNMSKSNENENETIMIMKQKWIWIWILNKTKHKMKMKKWGMIYVLLIPTTANSIVFFSQPPIQLLNQKGEREQKEYQVLIEIVKLSLFGKDANINSPTWGISITKINLTYTEKNQVGD